jgi:GAF domain-containing protein
MTETQTVPYERILMHCAAITSSIEMDELVEATIEAMGDLLGDVQRVISVHRNGYLTVLASEPPVAEKARRARLKLGTGLVGRAAADRVAIYSSDVRDDPRPDHGFQADDRSLLAVPLVVADELVGCLHAVSPEIGAFAEIDAVTLLSLAPAVATAFRNVLLVAQERASWAERRRLDEQKSDLMRRAAARFDEPLGEIRLLCHNLTTTRNEDLPGLGRQILTDARALTEIVDEILATVHRRDG